MKKIILFNPVVFWTSFMLVILVSCKKDKDVTPSQPATYVKPTPEQFQKNLSGKWNVQSNSLSNARVISTYISFEFFSTDNKYIAQTADTSYFGTYSINSTLDTLILPELGILAVDTMNATNFNFSVKQNGEDSFVTLFTTFVSPAIPSSAATDLLCKKMWTLNWQFTDIPNSDTVYFDGSYWVTGVKIYFSRNGTYFLENDVEGGGSTNTIKAWGWQDANQNAVLSGESESTLSQSTSLTITKLTDTEFTYQFKDASGNTIYASASRQ